MLSLIDADTLVFASACMAEGLSEVQAIHNLNNGLEHLLAKYGVHEHELFVTGEGNFRYNVYPEYKANRLKTFRPFYNDFLKDYLVSEYGAFKSSGCEADDLIGIRQYQCLENNIESRVISIDKDLDQLQGHHVSPEIIREGKTVKHAREYIISPLEAIRFFYYQLLVGDVADNIKGASGIGPVKATRILDGITEESRMLESVREHFSCEEELILNAKCAWIQRKPNEDIIERWKEFDTSIS